MDPVTLSLLAGAKFGSDIFKGTSEKKSLEARASSLRQQAERRLSKGAQEAGAIKTQGELSKTSMATGLLSSGAMTRGDLSQDMTLDEISNRARIEADIALEDASYEANIMRQDASAYEKQGKNAVFGSILGSIGDMALIFGRG